VHYASADVGHLRPLALGCSLPLPFLFLIETNSLARAPPGAHPPFAIRNFLLIISVVSLAYEKMCRFPPASFNFRAVDPFLLSFCFPPSLSPARRPGEQLIHSLSPPPDGLSGLLLPSWWRIVNPHPALPTPGGDRGFEVIFPSVTPPPFSFLLSRHHNSPLDPPAGDPRTRSPLFTALFPPLPYERFFFLKGIMLFRVTSPRDGFQARLDTLRIALDGRPLSPPSHLPTFDFSRIGRD